MSEQNPTIGEAFTGCLVALLSLFLLLFLLVFVWWVAYRLQADGHGGDALYRWLIGH